ncbi:MAG TPA: hypothetical protein VE915_04600 [Actinomycetota bacterium]|nr:hypothetical protein [Actinomycetota bacterium]
MADQPRSPDTPDTDTRSGSPPGMPTWVRVSLIIALVLLVGLLVSKLAGVEHGPGRHRPPPGVEHGP